MLNQFTVIENNVNKRPDVILFVNGIPLVVIELINPADENATVNSAFKQFQTYKQAIPHLFCYNGFVVISDGLEAKAGTISSGFTRFMAWKTEDGKIEASALIGQLETLVNGMLGRNTLLDLIRHFIVFEKSKKEDKETGIVTIETVKKIAAYHQHYAVNRAVESTLRASGFIKAATVNSCHSQVNERPASYGVPGTESQPLGDKKGGVVWHTQGSGKSLSMVFYTGKIVLAMDNPTIVVITDRNDLDQKKGTIKVVMTSASSDGPEISKHHTTKEQRRALSDRMKNPDDELKLVIFRDMWLTGFDAILRSSPKRLRAKDGGGEGSFDFLRFYEGNRYYCTKYFKNSPAQESPFLRLKSLCIEHN